MQFMVDLPDEVVGQVIPSGHDPARAALEGLAVEAYRTHRLSEHQLAILLGMSRYELDGFLKAREVWHEYSASEIEQELETGRRLWNKRQQELAHPTE